MSKEVPSANILKDFRANVSRGRLIPREGAMDFPAQKYKFST